MGTSNTPPRFNRYVMEAKGFLIYIDKGIAHALSNNFGLIPKNSHPWCLYNSFIRVLFSF
jgi:hypothetical protein